MDPLLPALVLAELFFIFVIGGLYLGLLFFTYIIMSESPAVLTALNSVLTSIGQAPVTTIERTNPDVAICYDTLMQVSKEVQSEGWTFNREFNYTGFPRDVNNDIVIPSNVLQLKLSDNSENKYFDAVQRSGKLYDRINHTYTWTFDPELDGKNDTYFN